MFSDVARVMLASVSQHCKSQVGWWFCSKAATMSGVVARSDKSVGAKPPLSVTALRRGGMVQMLLMFSSAGWRVQTLASDKNKEIVPLLRAKCPPACSSCLAERESFDINDWTVLSCHGTHYFLLMLLQLLLCVVCCLVKPCRHTTTWSTTTARTTEAVAWPPASECVKATDGLAMHSQACSNCSGKQHGLFGTYYCLQRHSPSAVSGACTGPR